ncbi:MAG: acetyl/propionyl/methylcrotonyl-CoA carboxylase subunit alpha [Lysobacteraceae bacterium]|nr:acetyl/propionyl/methylcrotonyl-CoA carboxylase subunit alpha [Xanthomonadaceae bacterium]
MTDVAQIKPALIESVLIANRGEIACRVIRTCRRLGIRSIAVYSDADANALHVRMADEAHHIGGSPPGESYLRGDAVLEAARRSGAQAIHPGYGFLSENADFADAVEAAGLIFIGPSSASMRKMGSKAGAKDLMAASGVPVVPGYTGEDQSNATLQREADRIGYPLMIKAAHGGGGKGMRIVRESGEFIANLESCQREAKNAFGRDRVLLERYIETPRHIEIQVFADSHGNAIHLNERECSAQRRYQKVLEESPSPFLDDERRAAMGRAAVEAARAIDYRNAGTVEFIVGADGGFYFMEINTRLQVEHPVTEMVTGLDLVEWQLRVASGEALSRAQDAIPRNGHAIEVRLYAEDPEKGFLPGSGKLQRLRLPPPSDSVRLDAGVEEGDSVSVFYDPMIAKLIVHAADRPSALATLQQALQQSEVVGPASNIAFLERLIAHPVVREARIHTGYLDQHLDEFITAPPAPPRAALGAALALTLANEQAAAESVARRSSDPHSPFGHADGWRLGHQRSRPVWLDWRGERLELNVRGDAMSFDFEHEGDWRPVQRIASDDGHVVLDLDGQRQRIPARRSGEDMLVFVDGQRYRFHPAPVFAFEGEDANAADRIVAPMPGRIVSLQVAVGAAVSPEQPLLVMEAMKMELTLRAPRDGVIAALSASVGEFVEADAVLVNFEVDE